MSIKLPWRYPLIRSVSWSGQPWFQSPCESTTWASLHTGPHSAAIGREAPVFFGTWWLLIRWLHISLKPWVQYLSTRMGSGKGQQPYKSIRLSGDSRWDTKQHCMSFLVSWMARYCPILLLFSKHCSSIALLSTYWQKLSQHQQRWLMVHLPLCRAPLEKNISFQSR